MPRTRLFDRDREIGRIDSWLSAPDGHLLTLSGPGGCGKTRLALEAIQIAERLGIETAFVALADAPQSVTIGYAIGKALGIGDVVDADLDTAIAAMMALGDWLLIFDNAEQVAEAVADIVTRLRTSAPDVSVLVTSRRRLRIDGEVVLSVRPLAVPESDDDFVEIGRAASVELFCERVATVLDGFELGTGNAAAVAAICRRLDGLPLAIELAAARCAQIGPVALAGKLARLHGLAFLDGALRAVPDRQRTVESVTRWSYDLLDDATQTVFRAVGALPGTWTLAVADSVAGRGSMVIDAVSELVDMNLVEPRLEGDEPLFLMLETVRAQALQLLVAANEHGDTLDRIAAYALEVARDTISKHESPHRRVAALVLSESLPTIRVGHERLRGTGRLREACEIALAVAPFLLDRGLVTEGLRWLHDAAPMPNHDDELGVDIEVWRSRLRAEIGPGDTRPRRATAWIAELEELRVRSAFFTDPTSWLRATDHLGHALTLAGRLDEAELITAQGLARCASDEHANWRTMLLHRSTLLAQQRDDRQAALERAAACMDLAKRIQFDQFIARAHQAVVLLSSDPTSDPTDALLHNLDLCLAADDLRFAVTALLSLGSVSLLQGDVATGVGYYLESLSLSRSIGWWHSQGFVVMGAAAAAALDERPLESARLHGAVADSLDEIANGMPPEYVTAYHDLQTHARSAVGDSVYESAAAVGDTMSWPQALDSAAKTLRLIQSRNAALVTEGAPPTRTIDPPGPADQSDDPTRLTAREFQVLELLAHGHTNNSIADELGISPKTVMHHSSHIFRKWGVRGRAAAVTYAFRNGYLGAAPDSHR